MTRRESAELRKLCAENAQLKQTIAALVDAKRILKGRECKG